MLYSPPSPCYVPICTIKEVNKMPTDDQYWETVRKAEKHLKSLFDREDGAYVLNSPEEKQRWTLRNLMIASEVQTLADFDEWWANEMADEQHTLELYPNMEPFNCTREQAINLLAELNVLRNARYNLGRDTITELAMLQSLCPIHFVDWAICFDDEPEDCSQVRAIFPNSHDT